MGNTLSKQPRTSFEVTPKLANAVTEIPETDYAIDQTKKAQIQDEAAKYLEKAEKAATKHIDEAYKRIASKKLNDNDLSAKDLLVKVQQLQKELDSRPKHGTFNRKVLEAREDLIECLTQNKDKPLVCYDQFTEFKKIVA